MKAKTAATMGLAALAAVAVLLAATPGEAVGPDRIRVEARFDNPTVYLADPGERYLEIEVVAPERGLVREIRRRPPLNVALVVDKSGSMAEARKLDYALEAARELIGQLEYGDRFALVTYDDRVEVPLPSQALEDRRRALRAVDAIRPGGATNLGGGLAEGFRQVRRHYSPDGINRVLLLSDGLANRGITSPWELSSMAAREGGSGVSLTTFGVGLEFNEDLLASLAESGRGTYYYIDRPHRIPEMLAREFSRLENVYAADVEITIEVRAGIVIDEVLGYRFRREGDRYVVTIGSLPAGERRRLICRLAPPRWDRGRHRVGKVTVLYQVAGERRAFSAGQDIELEWVDDRDEVRRRVNREVSERSSVFEANAARQRAAELVDRGDVAGARRVLRDNKAKLEAAPVQSEVVRQELGESASYEDAISAPMEEKERAAVQKKVKYRSYQTLQQK